MGVCYKCGRYDDYTDQFAVSQGAACWDCFYANHMTDEQRHNTDCSNQIGRIRTIIELPIEASQKMDLINKNANWDEIYGIKTSIEKAKQEAKDKVLGKLTWEDRRILGI